MYSNYRPIPDGLNFLWLGDLLNIYVFTAVSPIRITRPIFFYLNANF